MNIMVAFDFSDVSAAVLKAAEKHARLRDANLWLIHVAEPEPQFVGYKAGPPNVRHDIANHFQQEHKELHLQAEALRKAGITVTPLLVQGPTAATLLKEADRLQADMIIVGSHGHGAVHHLLVGSVTADVLKKARCPVLVVPTHNRQ